jgi:hypothetical protein
MERTTIHVARICGMRILSSYSNDILAERRRTGPDLYQFPSRSTRQINQTWRRAKAEEQALAMMPAPVQSAA